MPEVRAPAPAAQEVLLLAQHFPPSGGAGVQRASKLAKYLPRHGWRPWVITSGRLVEPLDPELEHDAREVEVLRVGSLEPPARWLRSRLLSLLYRLVRLVSVPDVGVWWVPSAYRAAVRRAEAGAPRAIVATGGPFSTFLVAVALRRRLSVPLVLDLRDPWTENPRRFPRAWYVFWRDPIERAMERFTLRRADRVVVVNAQMKELLLLGRDDARASVVVIPNGVDTEDFADRLPRPAALPEDTVNVVYVGTLHDEYHPRRTLGEGLRRFMELRAEVDVHLHVFGDNRVLALPGLEGRLHFHGYVAHRQAIAAMQAADVLLLLTGGHAHDQTGKIFEYLAASRPMLAVAHEDSAARHVADAHPRVEVTPPFDAEAFAHALSRLVDRRDVAPAGRTPAPHTRAEAAQSYAELLSSLTAGREGDAAS